MNDPVQRLQRLVLESLVAGRPTEQILDGLCLLVEEIVPHGLATVMRLDRERGVLRFRNAPSAPREVLEAFGELAPGPLSGSCGAAAHTAQLVAVADTGSDRRWQDLRDVARRFSIRSCWSVPMSGEGGEVLGTFGISRTVTGAPTATERELLEIAGYLGGVVLSFERVTQGALRHAELLRAVVEGSEDSIFLKDTEGRYLFVNSADARERGTPVEQVVGRTDQELFGAEEAARNRQTDRQVIETGRSLVYEQEFVSQRDGRRRPYLIRKDPHRDADGRVVGVLGIARDLTERRRVERALQQAQKLESLGVLAGGIAHDFNNLVTGILANVALLESPGAQAVEVAAPLADIRRAAERAAELTDQLLEYAGKRRPARRGLDLPALVEEVPALLASTISKKALLRFEFEPGLPVVEADPSQIRQVLLNLILNASEALEGRSGTITVRARLRTDHEPECARSPRPALPRGEWLCIEVEDDGVGMDEATQSRIFDPFFTTKFTGRGLGLASVQGIVGSHGGCIDVVSRPGAGTVFRLALPARPAPVTATPDGDAVGPPPAGVQGPVGRGRVLVVDDEAVVRDVLQRVLQRQHFDTVACACGDSGLAAFGAHRGALAAVIVDLTMPGLDGRELAGAIRRLEPDLPIVLTSGLAEADVRQRLDPESVDALLRKPFLPEQALAAIGRAMARRAAVRQRGRPAAPAGLATPRS